MISQYTKPGFCATFCTYHHLFSPEVSPSPVHRLPGLLGALQSLVIKEGGKHFDRIIILDNWNKKLSR